MGHNAFISLQLCTKPPPEIGLVIRYLDKYTPSARRVYALKEEKLQQFETDLNDAVRALSYRDLTTLLESPKSQAQTAPSDVLIYIPTEERRPRGVVPTRYILQRVLAEHARRLERYG